MTEQPLTVEDCVREAHDLLRGYGSLNLRSEGVRAELATTMELANAWLRMGEVIARTAPDVPTDGCGDYGPLDGLTLDGDEDGHIHVGCLVCDEPSVDIHDYATPLADVLAMAAVHRHGESRAPLRQLSDDVTATARFLAATAIQKLVYSGQKYWPTDEDEPLMSDDVEVQVRAALAQIVRSILR